jgi:hypothetical protein
MDSINSLPHKKQFMMIKDRKMRLQIANMKKHLKTFDKKNYLIEFYYLYIFYKLFNLMEYKLTKDVYMSLNALTIKNF